MADHWCQYIPGRWLYTDDLQARRPAIVVQKRTAGRVEPEGREKT